MNGIDVPASVAVCPDVQKFFEGQVVGLAQLAQSPGHDSHHRRAFSCLEQFFLRTNYNTDALETLHDDPDSGRKVASEEMVDKPQEELIGSARRDYENLTKEMSKIQAENDSAKDEVKDVLQVIFYP